MQVPLTNDETMWGGMDGPWMLWWRTVKEATIIAPLSRDWQAVNYCRTCDGRKFPEYRRGKLQFQPVHRETERFHPHPNFDFKRNYLFFKMGKRQFRGAEVGEGPRKRQRVVHEAPTSEVIHTSRQLRQLLAFDPDLGRSRHGKNIHSKTSILLRSADLMQDFNPSSSFSILYSPATTKPTVLKNANNMNYASQ